VRTCTLCGEIKTVSEFRPPPRQTQCRECYNTAMRAWRAKRRADASAPRCSVLGCTRPLAAQSLCHMHYNRLRRDGEVGTPEPRIGAGDDVRYQAVHRRLMKERGPASLHVCTCGVPAGHWAFIESEDDTKVQVDGDLRYSTNLDSYVPLCFSCHRINDQGSVGERNGKAVLTEGDVRVIRERYAAGGVSQRALAAEFGVNQSNISAIIRRRSWRHVQ
jgi:thymidine kinase